jgi:hypothetical protein
MKTSVEDKIQLIKMVFGIADNSDQNLMIKGDYFFGDKFRNLTKDNPYFEEGEVVELVFLDRDYEGWFLKENGEVYCLGLPNDPEPETEVVDE